MATCTLPRRQQRAVWQLPALLRRWLAARVAVRDALQYQVFGEEVTICGWVTSVRKQKEVTFVSVSDGSSAVPLQLLAPTDSLPHARDLNVGCSVSADGSIAESTHPSQRVEMQVKALHLLGDCDPMEYPFKARVRHTSEYARGFPHLRARTNAFSSLLRIRHSATMAIHDFFQRSGFISCHTPILSSSDCEGAGDLFQVKQTDSEDEFFGHNTFLTVSGQLHAEAVMSGMTSVYTFGPTFRAEKSHTQRHLAEFYMVEAETVTPRDARAGLKTLMKLIEDLVTSTVTTARERSEEDVEFFTKMAERSQNRTLMASTLIAPFQRIPYTEAIQLLQDSGEGFHVEPQWGCDLTGEHEQYLLSHCGQEPLFVTDFPAATKPFYAKCEVEAGDRQTAASLDLLVPGVGEVVGGTVREDRYEVLKEKLERENSEAFEQYRWYLDLRRFGSVPHGGFGLGFERLLQSMLGLDNIRDVIPFPRYAGSCQL